jgi:hypothetical protein
LESIARVGEGFIRLVKQLDFFNVFFISFGAVILFFYAIHDFVSKFKT